MEITARQIRCISCIILDSTKTVVSMFFKSIFFVACWTEPYFLCGILLSYFLLDSIILEDKSKKTSCYYA